MTASDIFNVVDMMIYKSQAATLLRFGIHTNNSGNVAVVILAPEHYDRSGQQLVGSQAMRVRQLTMLGFRVMQVNMMKANVFNRTKKRNPSTNDLLTFACPIIM